MALILINPNRKRYGYFKFKYKLYNIFHGKQGVDIKILKRGFEEVDVMQSYYSKVCIIFLEFHLKQFSSDNLVMSDFMKALKSKLAQKYKSKISYLWVRERHKAPAQHYHLAIMINGHKCNNGWSTQQIANDIWRNQKTGNTTYFVKRTTYNLLRNNEVEANAARVRLSYFAKNRTKERNLPCNNFSASRTKLNPKGKFSW
jgi:hypothetical protein